MVPRKEQPLRTVYFDPKRVGSYGGVEGLRRVTRLSRKKVAEWLSEQDAYTVHKAGGALPYFASAQYQRDHGLGSLFSGLLRSAMPLIKRGALALGKGALKTGVRIPDDVMSGQSIKTATKRRVANAGRNLMHGLVVPGVRPRKRIKRAPAKKGVTLAKRRRKRQTSTKREADIFDNDDDGTRT